MTDPARVRARVAEAEKACDHLPTAWGLCSVCAERMLATALDDVVRERDEQGKVACELFDEVKRLRERVAGLEGALREVRHVLQRHQGVGHHTGCEWCAGVRVIDAALGAKDMNISQQGDE